MLDFLKKVWGRKPGWVSVPIKEGKKWREALFEWPNQSNEVLEHIVQNSKIANVYFCPTVLVKGVRKKGSVKKTNLLWADLDEVNPKDLKLKPTLAWQSSPGRYQCIWVLDKEVKASKVESINKGITYSIGADRGGWDLTQVLRIPGTRNHKYENSPKVKLLWDDGPEHKYKKVKKYAKGGANKDSGDSDFPERRMADNAFEILSRLHPSQDFYKLLFTPEDKVEVGERSDKLWEIECLLAEMGCDHEEIAQVVQYTAWNKFKDREDGYNQLLKEARKAIEHVGEQEEGGFKSRDFGGKWVTYAGLMGRVLGKPSWLVEDFWPVMGHGMIAGEPKTYKSIISTDLAIAVASGKPFLGQYKVNDTGPILIVQEENSPRVVQDRINKITYQRGALNGGAERLSGSRFRLQFPDELPIHFLNNSGFDLTSEACRELLESKISSVRPAIVIFDPLYLMLGGLDENSARDLRPMLNWLIEIKYKYSTGIIILHHWNKSGKSERGGQRMLGSATFHGWVESALYCSIKNEQEHRIKVEREYREFEKPKNIEIQFSLGKPGSLDYSATVKDSNDIGDMDLLMMISGAGGMTEAELIEVVGTSRSTVKRRLEQLHDKGYVQKVAGKGKNKTIYMVTQEGRSKTDGED